MAPGEKAMRTLIGALAVASAVLLVTGGNAEAQTNRWSAWAGCWDRVSQDVRDTAPRSRRHDADAVEIVEQAPPRVCVKAFDNINATLTTTVPDQPASEQTVIADGSPHPVKEVGCQGTEQAEWSTSGRLLFTRVEASCEDGVQRSISGLALITDDEVWIDIRSFSGLGRLATRVSRYERVDSEPADTEAEGRATLTLAELKEASGKVSESVLEAAVMEAGANVQVSRRTLVDLADARVPPRVLDVMIALAYPEHFIVERVNGITRTKSSPFSPVSQAPADIESYAVTGQYYPAYYYSPFSYTYIGPQPSRVTSGGGGIAGGVYTGSSNALIPVIVPDAAALAVRGQGYTVIRPNDTASHAAVTRAASGEASSGPVSSGSSSSGSTSSSSSSSSSGSSTSASPSGFSGGGSSGGGTGRTAQPR
jgi:hypothetical protein